MTVGSKRFRELEATIDGVVASYGSPLEINNLESSALPNKRAVIEAIEHVKAACFVGFYSTRFLQQENLRHTIAEHLYPAHALLVEQIERALTYVHWMGRSESSGAGSAAVVDGIPPAGSGEAVVLDLFKALPELRRLINTDVRAAYRIAHCLFRAGVPMIPRMITESAHARTGIDISPGAQIGERFFIDHGTGVVIGETSVIGTGVKLYQGVTLGALSVPRRNDKKKRHPTLEDNVTIYAGATILGGETVIGANSVIGGNVWLTKSVPPGTRLFGRGREDDG